MAPFTSTAKELLRNLTTLTACQHFISSLCSLQYFNWLTFYGNFLFLSILSVRSLLISQRDRLGLSVLSWFGNGSLRAAPKKGIFFFTWLLLFFCLRLLFVFLWCLPTSSFFFCLFNSLSFLTSSIYGQIMTALLTSYLNSAQAPWPGSGVTLRDRGRKTVGERERKKKISSDGAA